MFYFCLPLGHAGVDSNANELSLPLLPPTSPGRPPHSPAGRGAGRGDTNTGPGWGNSNSTLGGSRSLEKGGLHGLMVFKRLYSPPAPATSPLTLPTLPESPEARRYFFISSSTCCWLPECNCSNSAARSPPHADGSLPAGGGCPEGIWGNLFFFFPASPDRCSCKRLNVANCRRVILLEPSLEEVGPQRVVPDAPVRVQ